MNLDNWLGFVLASTVLLAIPGPTILALISYSISGGRNTGAAMIAGVALGDSTALAASLLGLGAVLSASAFWFTVVKVIGGLYLLYLGVSLLFADVKPLATKSTVKQMSSRAAFTRIYVITALNPKGIVFFIAFLPQFVSAESNVLYQLSVLSITFVLLASLNAFLYFRFARTMSHLLNSVAMRRRFNLGGGMLLLGAGLWTLMSRRPV